MPDRPEIVCLCGSVRFADEMAAANRDLTLAGAIVLAPAVLPRTDGRLADEQVTDDVRGGHLRDARPAVVSRWGTAG